jgi:outer membrane protein
VVNAQNDLETARILLAQLLNIPYNKNREVERLVLSDLVEENKNTTDSIYQAALQNLAIVKAAELRMNSAVYGVKSYKSQRYPTLYFNGGLFTNYSSLATTQQFVSSADIETTSYVVDNGGSKLPVIAKQDNFSSHKIPYGDQFSNNFNSSVSIGLSVPILNNFRNKTQIKTALLQQKDAEIVLNTTKVQLQQNVEQAYVNVTSAKERFAALTDQVNAYNESFRVAEIKFNAGAINSVDYLVVKNALDQSNLNLIIAKYDYVLRSMLLDYYSGKLKF